MLEITRRKKGILIKEKYFDDHITFVRDKKEDLIFYVQSKVPFPGSTEFENLHVDLKQREEVLFASIKKGTRYEIKRALERDDNSILNVDSPTDEQIIDFKRHFDSFAVSKGISTANVSKMIALRDIGSLCFTIANKENKIMTWHVYICDHKGIRARLLYSLRVMDSADSKEDMAFSGRQNRLLHWKDILYFKELGIQKYDFGGAGTKNTEIEMITKFKKEFGGIDIIEYNGMIGITFIGKVIASAFNLYSRMH